MLSTGGFPPDPLWLQQTYCRLVGHQFKNFRPTKKSGEFCFRCPYCLDDASESSRRASANNAWFGARGIPPQVFFKCQRCTMGKTLRGFLKEWNPSLYDEYVAAVKQERGTSARSRAAVAVRPFRGPALPYQKPVTQGQGE